MFKVLVKIILLCFMLSISFSTVKARLSSFAAVKDGFSYLERSPRRELQEDLTGFYRQDGEYDILNYRRDNLKLSFVRNLRSSCLRMETNKTFRTVFIGPYGIDTWFKRMLNANYLISTPVVERLRKFYKDHEIDITNDVERFTSDENPLKIVVNKMKITYSKPETIWFFIFEEEPPKYYDDVILTDSFVPDVDIKLSTLLYWLKLHRHSLNFLVTKNVFNDYMVLSAKLNGAPYHSVYLVEEGIDPTFYIMDAIKGHLAQCSYDEKGVAGFYDMLAIARIGPILPNDLLHRKKLAVTVVMRGRYAEAFYPYEVEFASCHVFLGPLSGMLQLKYAASVVFVNEQGVYLTRSYESIDSVCQRMMQDMLQPNKQYTSMVSYESIRNVHEGNVNEGDELVYVFLMHEPEFNDSGSLHQDLQQWFTVDSSLVSHFIWISRTVNKDRLPGIAAIRDTTPIALSAGAGNAVLEVRDALNRFTKILRRSYMQNVEWIQYSAQDKIISFDSLHFVFPNNPSALMSTLIIQLLNNNMRIPSYHLDANSYNQRVYLGFGLYPSVQYIRDMGIDCRSCQIHGPSAKVYNNQWTGSMKNKDHFFVANGSPADAVWMGVTNCLNKVKGSKKQFILFAEGLPRSEAVDVCHDTFIEMQNKLQKDGAKLLIVVPEAVLAEWQRHVITQRYINDFQSVIRVIKFGSDESMDRLLRAAKILWDNAEDNTKAYCIDYTKKLI